MAPLRSPLHISTLLALSKIAAQPIAPNTVDNSLAWRNAMALEINGCFDAGSSRGQRSAFGRLLPLGLLQTGHSAKNTGEPSAMPGRDPLQPLADVRFVASQSGL